jgi:hypothetical protein
MKMRKRIREITKWLDACNNSSVGLALPMPEPIRKLQEELDKAKAELLESRGYTKLYSEQLRQAKAENAELKSQMFWSHVDRTGDCWNWLGWKDNKGYGQLHWQGKMRLCHRIAAFLSNMIGSVEFDGETCILHNCDNPLCCRPEHLFVGTQQDNIADMNKKGRQVAVTGDRHWCSKLTEDEFQTALKRIDSGESIRRVARDFNVTNQSLQKRIRRFKNRRSQ